MAHGSLRILGLHGLQEMLCGGDLLACLVPQKREPRLNTALRRSQLRCQLPRPGLQGCLAEVFLVNLNLMVCQGARCCGSTATATAWADQAGNIQAAASSWQSLKQTGDESTQITHHRL